MLLLMGMSQFSMADANPCPPSPFFEYELCYSADNESVQIYIDPVHIANHPQEVWAYGGVNFDINNQPLIIPITGLGVHITHSLVFVYDYTGCDTPADPSPYTHQAHIDYDLEACDGLTGTIYPTLYSGGTIHVDASISDPVNGNLIVPGSDFSQVNVNGTSVSYSVASNSGIIIQNLNNGDIIDVEYRYTELGRDNCCYFTESFIYRDYHNSEIPCDELFDATQFTVPTNLFGHLNFSSSIWGALSLEVAVYDQILVDNVSVFGSSMYSLTQIPTSGPTILHNLSGLFTGQTVTLHYSLAGCPMTATFQYGGRGKLSNITEEGFNITYADNMVSVRNLGESGATLKISDILGRTVYSSNESEIDMNSLNLNTGIYNVEVVSENERKTMKIMVQ